MSAVLQPSQSPTFSNDFLNVLATTVTRAQTLEELVRPLLDLLQKVTGLDSTYLTTIDERVGILNVLYSCNTRQINIPEGLSVPWEGTLCKRAIDENCHYADDVPERWGDCDAASVLGIATYVSTPIQSEDGELFGTLCAASETRTPMSQGTQEVLKLFAQMIMRQVEREKLVGNLNQANSILASSALTDQVTQLPNRRALMNDMQRRLSSDRNEQSLIVAFIDLDNFKTINDRHGHDIGDRFLEAVAERLRSVLRNGDLAARIGGDEFVVLATAGRSDADLAAAALKKRLTVATQGRFALNSIDLDYAGPSIGVTVAKPNCSDAELLLIQADSAMYAAKRERKAQLAAAH